MSAIKGFLDNFMKRKIKFGTSEIYDFEQQYASLLAQGESTFGLKTNPKGLGQVAIGLALDAADANSVMSPNILKITAHTLLKNDVVRFTTGNVIHQEVQVVKIIDVDHVVVTTLSETPALSEGFTHLRPLSFISDLSGNQFVSSAARTVLPDSVRHTVPTLANVIPAIGTYLQVNAATSATVFEIQWIADIGFPVELFTGAAAAEAFLCTLPLTPDEKVTVQIAAGTRLSISSATAAAIDDASSFFAMNLIG